MRYVSLLHKINLITATLKYRYCKPAQHQGCHCHRHPPKKEEPRETDHAVKNVQRLDVRDSSLQS